MLLARGPAGVLDRQRRVRALGLILILGAVLPFAHAIPSDPGWVAGIYDDADFDDVVVLVTPVLEGIEPVAAAPGRPVSECGCYVTGTAPTDEATAAGRPSCCLCSA